MNYLLAPTGQGPICSSAWPVAHPTNWRSSHGKGPPLFQTLTPDSEPTAAGDRHREKYPHPTTLSVPGISGAPPARAPSESPPPLPEDAPALVWRLRTTVGAQSL